MNQAIEKIVYNGKILAIIVRTNAISEMEKDGKDMLFASPDEFPFQVGVHSRKKDETIQAHFHVPFLELKDFTVQEFFYIISGKLKIDLYDDRENDNKVSEVVIGPGDSIILNTGHGFKFIEDTKMLELKQGPYRGKENEKRMLMAARDNEDSDIK